jgi:hypothetical protein
MKFINLIETRYADPITALDVSLKYICLGSAMGRISFYHLDECKELVLFDSQPELIRGISHSQDGGKIYVSIGDVCFHIFDSDTLATEEPIYIVEDVEEKAHKANCERAYTMNRHHKGVVLTINQPKKGDAEVHPGNLKAINVVDLVTKNYEPHEPVGNEIEFN